MTAAYRDLCRITEAAFQADLARMRALTAEEAGLRASLADLDRQLRESLAGAAGEETSWRVLGADEAWRKWLMRRKSEVNMQLARLQVRKAEAIETLKRSFARRQVSGEILGIRLEEARIAERRRD